MIILYHTTYQNDSGRIPAKTVAHAIVKGSSEYPNISGLVTFSPVQGGTWVEAEIGGLPPYHPASAGKSPVGPFGFHIHSMPSCAPMSGEKSFEEAGGHYNPDHQLHGNHAGDFPVLFSNGGYSRMSFYTNRFTPEQVVGKSVMIHLNPDDYRTEPAGNSGKRIACGTINRG